MARSSTSSSVVWSCHFAITPGQDGTVNAGVVEALESSARVALQSGLKISWSVRSVHFDLRRNAYQALCDAFVMGADPLVYLEDDVIVSPDFFRVCEDFVIQAYAGTHQNKHQILLFQSSSSGGPSNQFYVEDTSPGANLDGLFGHGFILTRRTWSERMSPAWWSNSPKWPDAWDYAVGQAMADYGDVVHWRPCQNRVRNIGFHGTNSRGVLPSGCNLTFMDARKTFKSYEWKVQ